MQWNDDVHGPCLRYVPQRGSRKLFGLSLVYNLDEWPYRSCHGSCSQLHLWPEKRHFLYFSLKNERSLFGYLSSLIVNVFWYKRIRFTQINIHWKLFHNYFNDTLIFPVVLLFLVVWNNRNIFYIRSRVQKFPAWHTKAAPNGKCCEVYTVPSMVRLMYQLKSVLK